MSFNNKNNEIYDIIVYIKRSASTGLYLLVFVLAFFSSEVVIYDRKNY